ncbi:hypothetical protein WMY93_009924 [Mugilogobius chulae]|uniref:Uncharacterized protein n=1 Tax=Mugilogobius chulae TaxID=88201 RepID=A0AAW0P791_9GOBI
MKKAVFSCAPRAWDVRLDHHDTANGTLPQVFTRPGLPENDGREKQQAPATTTLIENLGQGGEQKTKPCKASLEALGQNIFNETSSDNKPGPSMKDTLFLELMDKEMFRDESNHWVAPLPFRPHRQLLSNNREHALSRLHSLSLNNTHLKGPDLNNSLIGVLIRFRKEHVAVLADVPLLPHSQRPPQLFETPLTTECGFMCSGTARHPGLRRAIQEGAHKYSADTAPLLRRRRPH